MESTGMNIPRIYGGFPVDLLWELDSHRGAGARGRATTGAAGPQGIAGDVPMGFSDG